MWGFQAKGAAPIVRGKIVKNPETLATAIRIGNPASWKQAEQARDESKGLIDMVSDAEILSAYRLVAAKEGVFVEPSSAAGLAGLIKYSKKNNTNWKIKLVISNKKEAKGLAYAKKILSAKDRVEIVHFIGGG